MLKFGFPLVCVALAVADATHADPMVCTTEAGVTHCEAPLNHYRMTGTREAIGPISRTTKVAAG
jgi:hypothetical protein